MMKFLKTGSLLEEERPIILELSKNGVIRIRNKLNKTIWEYPRSKKLAQLESDGLRSLKNGDALLIDFKKKNEFQLIFTNQIKALNYLFKPKTKEDFLWLIL